MPRPNRIGPEGIWLTNHDGFWIPGSIAALRQEHDFPIFAGCEVTVGEGHLLVFGRLDRYIFGMHRAAFVRDPEEQAGGVIVVAHPYHRRYQEEEASTPESYNSMVERACQCILFPLVDGVEVLNGQGSDAENAFAFEIGRRFNLRGTGASDAHRPEDVGTLATQFHRFQPVALGKHHSSG